MADAPFETLRSYLTELLRAALRDALARSSRALLSERSWGDREATRTRSHRSVGNDPATLLTVPEEPAVRNERTVSRRAAACSEKLVADALRDAVRSFLTAGSSGTGWSGMPFGRALPVNVP